jgi:hypothetical protein
MHIFGLTPSDSDAKRQNAESLGLSAFDHSDCCERAEVAKKMTVK